MLYKEFDADDGELTRTRKIRRGVIAKNYNDIISSIYNDKKSVDIDTEIKLQDGGSQKIITCLDIINMESEK